MTTANQHNKLLPHLFRQEYSKMTTVLCRHFGFHHIEIVEDIASETFLKACESWSLNGIPENPTAWLYTVAKNKCKDFFKRQSLFENTIKQQLLSNEIVTEQNFEFTNQEISDSQLAMIFLVCNPINSIESQICLALQILCGFSIEEISNAFLSKNETIKKRLLRARENLRKENFEIRTLNEAEITARIDIVLRTLYLLFNEGYFSKTNDLVIRKELCSEALKLTLILKENSLTNTSQTNALLALMSYQSSRLEARTNEKGEAIIFEEQDKNKWDKSLIENGNFYLAKACQENQVSKYHLEAAIAYWHTILDNENKWHKILDLYNKLLILEYSPVAALNRTFAFAKVYSNKIAIVEAEKLNLQTNIHFHSLLGYLYTTENILTAIQHYKRAIELTKSESEKQTLEKEIKRLENSITKK
jgi:RNA polymerase sigma factor (sigma-70 family)